MGAKRTSTLIPLCHPLALSKVAVDVQLDAPNNAIKIKAEAGTFGRTGAAMIRLDMYNSQPHQG